MPPGERTAPSGRIRLFRRWGVVSFALALLVSEVPASSFQEGEEIRPGQPFRYEEYMTLPRYCLAQSGIANKLDARVVPEEEVKNWYAMMGDSFKHVHHYCIAMMLVRRGNAAKKSMDRNAFYNAAIENFNYSIRRSDDAFPLKPEIYLRNGMTLRLLGKEGAASTEFHRAIALKADYTPAYSALADLLADLGQRTEALELLETGLRHVPDSKVLSSKKAELESLQPGTR